MLGKWVGKVWTGCIWLRTGTTSKFFEHGNDRKVFMAWYLVKYRDNFIFTFT